MTAERKSKTFQYKVAKIENGDGRSLRELLATAIRERPKAADRMMGRGAAGEVKTLLNNRLIPPEDGMLSGSICLFEPGAHQPVIDYDSDAITMDLEALEPRLKRDPATGRDLLQEFLNGIMYFGVYGNHVVVVQALSLRIKQLEDYINWLLRQSGTVEENVLVYLEDQIEPAQVRQINKTKSIKFLSPICFNPISAGREENQRVEIQPSGNGWDAVLAFLRGLAFPRECRIIDNIDDKSVQVALELKWIDKKARDHTPLLDQIANTIRNSEDIDFVIDMGDMGTITQNDFKLRKPFTVEIQNGLPNEAEIRRKMEEWLNALTSSGRILRRC